jgi:glycosyltransferase involved in cell wall biosynthesis
MSNEPAQSGHDVRLVVFSDAFEHRNGVGAYYRDLLDHFDGRIGAAELVCPGPTSAGKRQGLSIPLPGDSTQKLCLPGIPKAIRTMRKARPNVVVLATPGPYGILGLILARAFGVRCCVGYHTQYDKLVSMYWNRVFGRVSAAYLRLTDRLLFRLSSVVVTNSGPMAESARDLGARDVRLVGTPLEPRLLEDRTTPASGAFGPALFVGRLAREKNLEAVIEAARALPEMSFIIAGDGPLREFVESAARELPNIDYRGWLGRAALVDALDASEVLVVPSRVESFGTVAMEAMARERLVLVSQNCGIRDWPGLAEGVETMADGETLADALGRVAAWSPAERAAKAALARARAERFNKDTVDQWLVILDGLLRPEEQAPGETARSDVAE